jgi:hypothetical protein
MIIAIENFWTPTVCTDMNGSVLEFDSEKEAQQYIEENCQNGTVVTIN